MSPSTSRPSSPSPSPSSSSSPASEDARSFSSERTSDELITGSRDMTSLIASETGSSLYGATTDLGVVVPDVERAVVEGGGGDGGAEEELRLPPPPLWCCCCDRKNRLISSLCVSGALDSTDPAEVAAAAAAVVLETSPGECERAASSSTISRVDFTFLPPLPTPASMTESICCSSMSEGPEGVTLLRVFLLLFLASRELPWPLLAALPPTASTLPTPLSQLLLSSLISRGEETALAFPLAMICCFC